MKKILLLLLISVRLFSQDLSVKLTYKDSLKAKLILDKLTLREKCAQLVFAHGYAFEFGNDSAEMDRLEKLVQNEKIGGILFLQGDAEKLPSIVNYLQSKSKIPLLISGDLENGLGGRFINSTEFPPPMAIAATRDTANVKIAAKITAEEAKVCGILQNYAPVLDINENYKNPIVNYRSFSDDKSVVALFGSLYIKELQQSGIIATPKHFPGHGATDLDSHNILPEISKNKISLLQNELFPFKKAVTAGALSMMIAHLNVPSLTNDTIPVTLSRRVVSDLLKKQFGFRGLCVSDAMNMGAIVNTFGADSAIVKAVNAGIDVILFPVDEREAIDAIYDGVLFHKIKEERVLDAAFKIILYKLRLGLFSNPTVDIEAAKKVIGKKSHKRASLKIAEEAVTLLKNEDKIIPVDTSKYFSPLLIISRQTDRSDLLSLKRPLEKFLRSRMPKIKTVELSKLSKETDFRMAFEAAENSDLIVFAPYIGVQSFSGEIELNEKFKKFGEQIINLGKPFVLASFGSPYIHVYLPHARNVLISYGICNACEAAAAEALFGEIDINGKLPVNLPNSKFARGYGLNYKRDFLVFSNDEKDSLYDFSETDSLINDAISRKVFPGAQLLVAKNGKVILNKCYGRFTYSPESPKVTKNTLYDLASLTKPIATTTALMLLYDQGKISLNDYVVKYLPEFDNNGKDKITIEQLLLHTSGLRAGRKFYKKYKTKDAVVKAIMNETLINEPGEKFVYSDLGMIVLQQVIEKITRVTLDKFIYDNVFSKLNLSHICFNPQDSLKKFCAPTEVDNYWRMQTVQGTVHDETAALLGGVSGNAGLFSNASDIAVFVQMLLDGGIYKGKRILNKKTIELFTTRKENNRAYGWDMKSPKGYTSAGKLFSLDSFGHTGFTGTSIWVDRPRKLFVIFLTNRVYPTRKNREHIKFRPILHNSIIKAIEN